MADPHTSAWPSPSHDPQSGLSTGPVTERYGLRGGILDPDLVVYTHSHTLLVSAAGAPSSTMLRHWRLGESLHVDINADYIRLVGGGYDLEQFDVAATDEGEAHGFLASLVAVEESRT